MSKKEQGSSIKSFAFSLLALTLFVGTLEGLARFYEFSSGTQRAPFDAGFSRDGRIFLADTGKPGTLRTNPNKLLSFRKQSFQKQLSPGRFRIFFLGESSVNYLHPYLTSFAKRLEVRIGRGVEIINVGGLSYGSQRLALAALEMLDYHPDLLLIYMGHNEFEEVEQFSMSHTEYHEIMHAAYHLALVRVAVNYLVNGKIEALQRARKNRLASGSPDVARAWKFNFSMDDVQNRMAAFERNLNLIISTYSDLKIPVILGTIPSNLIHPYLPKEANTRYQEVHKLIRENRYLEARNLGEKILAETAGRHQSSLLENSILRKLANKFKLPIADVYQAVSDAEPHNIPGETLFNDHCHLNEKGNELLLQTFFDKIDVEKVREIRVVPEH